MSARVRLRIVQWRRLRGERKAVALFESRDILKIFFGGVADFQKIILKERDSIGKEFRQRPVQIAAKWRIQRILEYMREFPRNLRESRESIARGRAAERVRRNIKSLQVLVARLDFLQDAHVLPQILQVLRGFLEEHLDAFAIHRAHARPSATSSGFCNSSAVGLR